MKDPYAVLGVPKTASVDEVKKAYRDLARKYHPDNYVNNPLADLAEEKMKEINEAYDAIIKSRASSSGYTGSSNRAYSGSGKDCYAEIRRAISANDIAYAEELLSQISIRDAEWNFLMGSVMLRKGWYDSARSYFQRAYSMDPTNPEYAEALNRMSTPGGGGFSGGMITPCDCCAGLMCADCLCDCC